MLFSRAPGPSPTRPEMTWMWIARPVDPIARKSLGHDAREGKAENDRRYAARGQPQNARLAPAPMVSVMGPRNHGAADYADCGNLGNQERQHLDPRGPFVSRFLVRHFGKVPVPAQPVDS